MGGKSIQELKDIANKLRVLSIKATNASNSGHPTSCLSMAEIMSVLFFNTMKYKVSHPRDPNSDRFVLSKGHAAPVLYAAWAEAGLFPEEDVLQLRKIDCDLEGHPTPRLSFVDVATGSLGQGLSVSAGMAYTGKYIEKASFRVFCVIGDGESAEGSVWEALSFAGHYKLDNLVAIFDLNRLGQSEPTMFQHNIEIYRARLEAFGFNAIVIDGHDVEQVVNAFDAAASFKGKPTAVLAKTFKGNGIQGISDQDNWHGKPLGAKAAEFLADPANSRTVAGSHAILSPAEDLAPVDTSEIHLSEPPTYTLGEKVATRFAYGTALTKMGRSSDRIVALDADTKNSTYSDKFRKEFPNRFIECFIAEQNLIGVAVGCAARGRKIPFTSTFSTFYTRAFDQLRMSAISGVNIKCCGSHCGISIGEDGPSQMGLEEIALFRSLPGSTVFYPSDAVATERAVELAANTHGICFIRTGRPATPVIYSNEEPFAIGKAKIVRKSSNDVALIVTAGVTLYEALGAADSLSQKGVGIRVLDLFTVKPLDVEAILSNARACGGRIVTVEDHYHEGGIGEAVSGAMSSFRDILIKRIAVSAVPRSGPPDVLLDMFGISARHIEKAVMDIKEM